MPSYGDTRNPELIGTPEGKRGDLNKGPDGKLVSRAYLPNKRRIPRNLPEKYDEHTVCGIQSKDTRKTNRGN